MKTSPEYSGWILYLPYFVRYPLDFLLFTSIALKAAAKVKINLRIAILF